MRFDSQRVLTTTVVPTVNLHRSLDEGYGPNVTQHGSTIAPACTSACASVGVTVRITFALPFPDTPNVTHLRVHRGLTDPSFAGAAVRSAAATVQLAVAGVDAYGMTVAVTRSDGGVWGPGGGNTLHNMSIEYEAVSFLPRAVDRDGVAETTTAPHDNPWQRMWHLRFLGELVPAYTGRVTLQLVGGPAVRVLLNHTQVMSIKEIRYPDNYRLYHVTAEVSMVEGVAIPIEVQASSAASMSSDNHFMLSWSVPGVFDSPVLIPASAFRHRVRAMCLSHQFTSSRAYTDECLDSHPNQVWRVDGGFIRPSHQLYSDAAATTNTHCLTSNNHAWTDPNNLRPDHYVWDIRSCYPGGLIDFLATNTPRCSERCVFLEVLCVAVFATHLWAI